MGNPSCAEPTFYAIGRWEIYDYPFYVERNGNIQVEEFKTKEEALAFISKKVEENVNISWALCKSYPKSKQPIDKWKLKIS